MKLSAESTFEGERANALDAAKRLAAKHGMTLDEAARLDGFAGEPRQEAPDERLRDKPFDVGRFATAMHLMDYHLHVDKMRRDQALEEARARGLDREERRARPALKAKNNSRRRMKPEMHAAVLLRETKLPFAEVASITGMDIYDVVAMKLKMRKPESPTADRHRQSDRGRANSGRSNPGRTGSQFR